MENEEQARILNDLLKSSKSIPFERFKKNIESHIKYYENLNKESDIILKEVLSEMNTWSFMDILKKEKKEDLISKWEKELLNEIKKRLGDKNCKDKKILLLQKEMSETKLIYGLYISAFHNIFKILQEPQHRGILLVLLKKNINLKGGK